MRNHPYGLESSNEMACYLFLNFPTVYQQYNKKGTLLNVPINLSVQFLITCWKKISDRPFLTAPPAADRRSVSLPYAGM